ncbi:MAG: MCE family protein [Bdellovibrionales bacterium]|nr:MCE family protein [Bdellovibrionales bacterium]
MKQNKQHFEFYVGVFALFAFAVIIWMSLEVNRNSNIAGKTNTYYADFDSVTGLVPKIPVEVSGIIAGYVDTIELVNNKARVGIIMRRDVKVYKNAILLIRDRGVLGDRYVVLLPGSESEVLLSDGDFILHTQSMSDFEKLTQNLAETATILKELVQSDNPEGALGQTIVNLRNVTGKIDEMVADNKETINRILDNIDSLTHQIDQISKENRKQIHEMISSFHSVADSLALLTREGGDIDEAAYQLRQTMEKVNHIVTKLDQGEGTIGRLLQDDTTVDSINESLDGINNSLGLFRRVQLKFRYRGEFLAQTTELQNQFGISLYVAPDKYVLLEFNDAPVGEINVVDTTIESGGTTTTTRSIQTNSDLTITFMFAKRIRDASLRVGLIRSHGGVGLDWYFFKDHLVLSGEVFNLGRPNDNPFVRVYGSALLFNHFILTAGVDDLMSDNDRVNPFVGVGLQFTDNDFKALIPAVRGGL